MNYWINIHWPTLARDKLKLPSPLPDNGYHYQVYLPDGRQDAGQELRASDYVFIYETKGGRPRKDGKKYALGKQGIIALVRALEPILDTHAEPEEYADGGSIRWNWQARTQVVELHFCSHDDVCKILGYSTAWTLRGFGDQKSGLKKLTQKQFESLFGCFRASD